METFTSYSPFAFYMTLDTELVSGIKRQHRRLVARAATHMTTQAFNGQVLVALIDDLGTDRVC